MARTVSAGAGAERVRTTVVSQSGCDGLAFLGRVSDPVRDMLSR
jgi:hypothetical protein